MSLGEFDFIPMFADLGKGDAPGRTKSANAHRTAKAPPRTGSGGRHRVAEQTGVAQLLGEPRSGRCAHR